MEFSVRRMQGCIKGHVTHSNQTGLVRDAEVYLFRVEAESPDRESIYRNESAIAKTRTGSDGRFMFEQDVEDGRYFVRGTAFGTSTDSPHVHVREGRAEDIHLDLHLGVRPSCHGYGEGNRLLPVQRGIVGKRLVLRFESGVENRIETVRWLQPPGISITNMGPNEAELMASRSGPTRIEAVAIDKYPNSFGGRAEAVTAIDVAMSEPDIQMIGGNVGVTMHRTASDATLDQALWVAIRNRTNAITFHRYREFINRVLRWEEGERFPDAIERRMKDLGANLHGVGAYQILKFATEVFLLLECGVRIEHERHRRFPLDPLEERSRLGEAATPEQMQSRLQEYLGRPAQLPYITRVVEAAFPVYEQAWPSRDRVLTARINEPCLIELIWNYWHEEGMLNQTINAISYRFQNVRAAGDRDPLANMEIDPLRPLNNLLWGYVQDEVQRLSVKRRAYEYMHQYGLVLYGKAAPGLHAADNRSKFLEAFHNLLYQASVFFKEDFQTTVIADGFPLLNSLQEVHMVLAEGAHNQFGDLAWTARVEMMLGSLLHWSNIAR